MARILYQAKVEPVLTPAQRPEQVTESRWHQPLAEPTRRRALTTAAAVASGLFWSGFTPAPVETVTADKWQRPLSEPVVKARQPVPIQQALAWAPAEDVTVAKWLLALAEPTRAKTAPHAGAVLVKATPFEEAVSLDRWLRRLEEPVRVRPQLAAAAQPFLAFVKAAPFPESPDLKWYRPLEEPIVKARPGLRAEQQRAWTFAQPEDTSLTRWYLPLAEPVRQPLRLVTSAQQALGFTKAAPFAEAVSIDRWTQPLSEPVRVPARIATGAQQHLAFVKAAQFEEAVSADRWLRPLEQPTRRFGIHASGVPALFFTQPEGVTAGRWLQQIAQPVFARGTRAAEALYAAPYVVVAGETVTLDKWFAELVSPRRRPPGSAGQPATAYVGAAPFNEAVSIDRWLLPLGEPVRTKPALGVGAQQFQALVKAAPFGETIEVAKWFVPLSEPVVKSRPGLAAARQRWLAFAQPEDVTVSRWLLPLAEPVRSRPALLVAQQQAVWLVKAAPFAETVSIDRWLQALQEPQRQPQGLAARHQLPLALWPYPLPNLDAPAWVSVIYPDRVSGRPFQPQHQQALAFVKSTPFAETVSTDRWAQPLSTPVRRVRSVADLQAHIAGPALPVVASGDRWWRPFSEPTRRAPALQGGAVAGPAPLAVGLEHWFQPWAPTFVRPRAQAPQPVWIAVVGETVTLDKWHAWPATPTRVEPRPAGFVAGTPLVEAPVAAWAQPAGQPLHGRAAAPWRQAASVGPQQPYVAAVEGWWRQLEAPVLHRAPQPASGGYQSIYIPAAGSGVGTIEWFIRLSEPWFPWPTHFWKPYTFDWTVAAIGGLSSPRPYGGAVTMFGPSDALSGDRSADGTAAARSSVSTASARGADGTAAARDPDGTANPRT